MTNKIIAGALIVIAATYLGQIAHEKYKYHVYMEACEQKFNEAYCILGWIKFNQNPAKVEVYGY